MKSISSFIVAVLVAVPTFGQTAPTPQIGPQRLVCENGRILDCNPPAPKPAPKPAVQAPRPVTPPAPVLPAPLQPINVNVNPAPVNVNVTAPAMTPEMMALFSRAFQPAPVVQTTPNTDAILAAMERNNEVLERQAASLRWANRWAFGSFVVGVADLGVDIATLNRLGGIRRSVNENTRSVIGLGDAIRTMKPPTLNLKQNINNSNNNSNESNSSADVDVDTDVDVEAEGGEGGSSSSESEAKGGAGGSSSSSSKAEGGKGGSGGAGGKGGNGGSGGNGGNGGSSGNNGGNNNPPSKPGNGHGDKNHDHSGPPGQNKK